MPHQPKDRDRSQSTPHARPAKDSQLRIIGGQWRGRSIQYSGDPRTRPMKDNIREAVFNLIGGWIPGKLVVDLFAGTGAIGLEALSRGAEHAYLIEHHFATAKIIEHNVAELAANNRATVVMSDTFYWARQFLKQSLPAVPPWAVFCSPPYSLYTTRGGDMLELIASLWKAAPPQSVFVVESDSSFDARRLPQFEQWRIREYTPAVIHVWRPKDVGREA